MHFLVTGAAGFVGFHVGRMLLRAGHAVTGVDSLNDYYDPTLKRERIAQLRGLPGFSFERLDLADPRALLELPARDDIDRVIHLAAQAGVRHAVERPFAYTSSNVTGHLSVLEFCRQAARQPLLVYASSSSVYGVGAKSPYKEDRPLGRPVSLYAATKRADELMSESYAALYGLKQIGARLFTVYGPWGRPDMAYWLFAQKILRGEPVQLFNGGAMKRDFTYIDDVADALVSIARDEPAALSDLPTPHAIYNIGSGQATPLMDLISVIEDAAGRRATCEPLPMQPGDVVETCADIQKAAQDYGYEPATELREGVSIFVDWLRRREAPAARLASQV
ncbi:MAG: NAD-dependent epimerase/dehydratase family protein [Pseudomonadota bacterium]